MKYRAVFFDVDGTLISVYSVTRCLKEVFKHYDAKSLTLKEVAEKSMGYKVEEIIKKDFPELKDKVEEVTKFYHTFYSKNFEKYTKLLPYVKSTFNFLHRNKTKIGIITTKSRKTSLAVLRAYGLKFDVLVSSDDIKHRKPNPEPVLKACRVLGVKPKECIFFGDHSFDMMAAKAAGCRGVGVLTGIVKRKELKKSGADFIIENLRDAREIIEKGV